MKTFSLNDFRNLAKAKLGQLGEAIAARYIEEQLGWPILARNWSCPPHGELDLIAQDGDVLVVVEVRTRRGANAMDLALSSVDERKQERLMMLTELYQAETEMLDTTPIRIDVVGVAIQRNGLAQVEIVRDAIRW